MPDILQYIGMGLLLGAVAGISPGPLLALVISQSIRFGYTEGAKAALTPLITDIPAVLLSVFIISEYAGDNRVFGIIAFAGAAYVLYLGIESIYHATAVPEVHDNTKPNTLTKGILTNLLNPHPYMFWISVGTPLIIKALKTSIWTAIFFVLAFYVAIVGSKIILAFMAGKSRLLLTGTAYVWTIRLLGIALIVIAAFLAKEGYTQLF